MTKFRVKSKVRISHGFGLFGEVTCEFKAGDVTPKNEQEEACLEHLALTTPQNVTRVEETADAAE